MTRGPLHGVAQIVRFNWPSYVAGLAVVALSIAALRLDAVTGLVRAGVWAVAVPTAWWLVASLLASHWVYDRSRLYAFDWLRDCLDETPRDWIHLHAGLDESTGLLEQRLGVAPRAVHDFFRAEALTEPSLARARKLRRSDPRTRPAPLDALPLEAAACDAVFSVFSAHEVRDSAARAALFREMARVLRPAGAIVLVEHLRDLPNFVAYGPGSLHFLGRSAWQETAAASGLAIRREVAITPLVKALVLRSTGGDRQPPG